MSQLIATVYYSSNDDAGSHDIPSVPHYGNLIGESTLATELIVWPLSAVVRNEEKLLEFAGVKEIFLFYPKAIALVGSSCVAAYATVAAVCDTLHLLGPVWSDTLGVRSPQD